MWILDLFQKLKKINIVFKVQEDLEIFDNSLRIDLLIIRHNFQW